jgi:hypothetical protein
MPGVQAGMAAEDQPSGGLISAREERIFHFQQFVLQKMRQSGLGVREHDETPILLSSCEGGCHVSE